MGKTSPKPKGGLLETIRVTKEEAKVIEKSELLHDRLKIDRGLPLTAAQRDRIDQIPRQIAILEALEAYTRPQDIFADYSTMAAKRLIIEAETAKSAKDRIAAANKVLEYEIGKPLARTANLNLNSTGDLSPNELTSEIKNLLGELGFTKNQIQKTLLLDDEQSDLDKILDAEVVKPPKPKKPKKPKKKKPLMEKEEKDGSETLRASTEETNAGEIAQETSSSEGAQRREQAEKLRAESGLPDEFF